MAVATSEAVCVVVKCDIAVFPFSRCFQPDFTAVANPRADHRRPLDVSSASPNQMLVSCALADRNLPYEAWFFGYPEGGGTKKLLDASGGRL